MEAAPGVVVERRKSEVSRGGVDPLSGETNAGRARGIGVTGAGAPMVGAADAGLLFPTENFCS